MSKAGSRHRRHSCNRSLGGQSTTVTALAGPQCELNSRDRYAKLMSAEVAENMPT